MSTKSPYLIINSFVFFMALFAYFLNSNIASATDTNTSQDNVTVSVPVSCTMNGTGMTSHNANIPNGTYQADIGTTTLKSFCNDNQGFAIYAIGYTNEEYGNTTLIGATGGQTIVTGTATTTGSPDVSNWAVKLATDSTATYPITLDNSFGAYSSVPSTYTKVAHRDSGTDLGSSATGASLTTTYAAYISKTQKADTYDGKVKYTLVHPSNADAPTPPPAPSPDCDTPVPNLTYMQDINSSNKSTVLSSMIEDAQYYLRDKRDEKPYCVAKLRDGNIWMTQNLDHDIDSTKTYTSQDTDVLADWTPIRSTYATNDLTWDDQFSYGDTTPESYDAGELYWNGAPADPTLVSAGSPHYHLGNYYNWTAAIAMNDSSSYITQYQDVNQSICPANWTLPKGGNNVASGSFQYLITQYGWDNSSQMMQNPNIWDSPIKASISGNWHGLLEFVGDYGFLWSSVVYSEYDAYELIFANNGFVGRDGIVNRYEGYNVRCLAR